MEIFKLKACPSILFYCIFLLIARVTVDSKVLLSQHHRFLYVMYSSSGYHTDAVRFCDSLTYYNPHDLISLVNLGYHYEQLGEFGKAKEANTKVLIAIKEKMKLKE